jgi:hypothetical protein
MVIFGIACIAIGVFAYRWLAWNILTKDFQAVCTEPTELTGDDVGHYLVVDGPYTREFWDELKRAYSFFSRELNPKWADWQGDGTLRVPIGFDFEPSETEGMTFLHYDRRAQERSHVLATAAAIEIFQRRKSEGADLSSFKRYAYSIFPERNPATIKADTCGVMKALITAGGALSQSSPINDE